MTVILSFLVVSILMVATWEFSVRRTNAGYVDVSWSFAFAIIALIHLAKGPGYAPRRWLICGMLVFWSLRLGLHLLARIEKHHPDEDSRYAALRLRWGAGAAANLKFLVFFELQAVLAVLLSAPFIWVSANPAPEIHRLEWGGLILWALALAGESLADAQLRAFLSDPANRGRVCEAGLWRYSRHPNYFFEWLIWIGFAVFALASPLGWTALLSAGAMFVFLNFVTGVPAAEAQSLRSKGEAYRRYQQSTSAFIPWFRS